MQFVDEGKEFTIAAGIKFVRYISSWNIFENRLTDELMFDYVQSFADPRLPALPVKTPPERHPLSEKKKLFTAVFTRNESHETTTTMNVTKRMNFNCPVDETSESIEPNDDNLRLNGMGYNLF